MEKWFVTTKKADFDSIAREFQISPILARIIRNRDVEGQEAIRKFLYGSREDLFSPFLLKDMELAIDLIEKGIQEKKKMRIIGDYDVDGICSTHILLVGLTLAGAIVDTAIPHRMKDGYGINEQLIEEAKEEGIEFIITCDNGIAAIQQIEMAKKLGMTVIITDHHEVPYGVEGEKRIEQPPNADAIINPKQSQCDYPFKGICGGVVAFKLIQGYFLRKNPDKVENLVNDLLPFAAMATVCDVMELLSENRIIVKEGLKRLREQANQGVGALMAVNGIEPEKLSAYHLGFVIGPCLNATGRLDTATRALDLFACKDKANAMNIASELKELNESRKSMTLKGVEEATEQINSTEMINDKVLVIYLPDCHESLAGIIAGRIRESYMKPVFVLTDGEDGIKGSGRSIDAYHMYEEMNSCSQCFSKFGGHKMAAGLSMQKSELEHFKKLINDNCKLTEEDYYKKIHIDVPMPLSFACKELAMEVELLEPFGTGNPKPLFAHKKLTFLKAQKMGAKGNFAKFQVRDDKAQPREIIYFGDLEKFHNFLKQNFGETAEEDLYTNRTSGFEINITYQIGMNYFRGNETVQIIMQDFSCS